MTVRPAWILTAMIVLGWVIGVVGDIFTICPSYPPGLSCSTATFYLAQSNYLVVYYNQFFQMGTSILVTDSLLDAGFNAIAVLVLDRFSDISFNTTRYMGIFFGSALAGNALTLLFGPNYASAGASGGIFGLFAAVFSYTWAQEKRIDTTTLGIFLVIFVTSSILPDVNWLAHVGGSLAGFVAGPALAFSLRSNTASYGQTTESKTITKIIVGFLIAGFFLACAIQFLQFALR